MCLFTRYVIAVPLASKKATVVAEALFTHEFAVHGLPDYVRSDEGKEFVNSGLQNLYQQWGIQPILTGGYRPWANPVERYHRYINREIGHNTSKLPSSLTMQQSAAAQASRHIS
jgi:hypothetical protein